MPFSCPTVCTHIPRQAENGRSNEPYTRTPHALCVLDVLLAHSPGSSVTALQQLARVPGLRVSQPASQWWREADCTASSWPSLPPWPQPLTQLFLPAASGYAHFVLETKLNTATLRHQWDAPSAGHTLISPEVLQWSFLTLLWP